MKSRFTLYPTVYSRVGSSRQQVGDLVLRLRSTLFTEIFKVFGTQRRPFALVPAREPTKFGPTSVTWRDVWGLDSLSRNRWTVNAIVVCQCRYLNFENKLQNGESSLTTFSPRILWSSITETKTWLFVLNGPFIEESHKSYYIIFVSSFRSNPESELF